MKQAIAIITVASLMCGCGSSVKARNDDATTDTSVDTGDDTTVDTGADPVVDGPADTAADVPADSPMDTVVDTGTDADAVTEPDVSVPVPPSCESMDGTECWGDDCCAVDLVPGGWFAMGRGEGDGCATEPTAGAGCTTTTATCLDGTTTWGCPEGTWLDMGGDDSVASGAGADEAPEHAARVDGYLMDRYEVTVGRMRAFVDAYDRSALVEILAAGAGAHPLITGSAWQSSWDVHLPDTAADLEADLECDDAHQTWTHDAGGNETFPINCTNWYLAYAFCAWDGGRLATSAEWERAAAGDDNRLYAWGSSDPDSTRANYSDSDGTPLVDVFDKPAGAGQWGHQGLAGSVWEWALDFQQEDWYATTGNDCVNCANLSGSGGRILRGGDFQYGETSLRAAELFTGGSASYWLGHGLRCVRDL